MPGRPRRNRYEINAVHGSTSEFVHDLLVRELNATLVPDSDKTVPAQWAPPLEKKEDANMGLFDQYAAEGLDLGQVKLDPYSFKDGTYLMAFVGAEVTEPSNEDWDPGIQFDFIFISNADGSPTDLKDRRYQEKMRYPTTIKHDDDDKAKAAKKAIDRIAQRMYSLGVPNPLEADIADINKLKGQKFVVSLKTGTAKEAGAKPPQWFNILGKQKTDAESTSSFFDQD